MSDEEPKQEAAGKPVVEGEPLPSQSIYEYLSRRDSDFVQGCGPKWSEIAPEETWRDRPPLL